MSQVFFDGSLFFWIMGKNPFDFRMRVFSRSLGQLKHVGFDACGGDI
jgi:hypothetical protein